MAAMLVGALLIAATLLLIEAGHVTELSMPEEQPTGTLVGSVRENPDVNDLMTSSLRFNFRFSSGPYELFMLDNRSGDIRTARRVDREQLCPSDLPTPSSTASCSLELDVTVLPLEFYRILKVRIIVEDINDHAPSFPQPRVSLEIKESSPTGTRVPLPAAEDPDVDEFSVQRYELTTSSSVFRLAVSDTPDGGGVRDVWLTLGRRLDREQQQTYSLTITAYDGGTPPKTGSLHIQVLTVVIVINGCSNKRWPRRIWRHLANESEQAYLYTVQWATFSHPLPYGGVRLDGSNLMQ